MITIIKIYPSPTSYKLTIDTNLAIDSAEIFDSNGRKVIVTTAIEKTINVVQLKTECTF